MESSLFSQLASISAVLGGFALTFLGALLTLREHQRLVGWTAFLAITAAAVFVLCALGWSFIGAALPAIRASSDIASEATLRRVHISLMYTFVCGVFGFLATLGLSGWLHSRALGLASSAVAVLAGTAFVILAMSL